MRLKHRDDTAGAHNSPRGLQRRRNLCRVVSVIVKKANAAKLPMELESTVSSTKPTHRMRCLGERQACIDEHTGNSYGVERVEPTRNSKHNLGVLTGVGDVRTGHGCRIHARNVKVSVRRKTVSLDQ
jgi:hypothetical protein